MGDVTKGEGRTVLFVSHNLAAVNTLCNKGIVLEQGNLKYDGNIKGAMDYYLSTGNTTSNHYISEQQSENDIWEIKILNQNDQLTSNFYFNEDIKIRIKFKIESQNNENAEIGIRVTDQKERVVFTTQKPIDVFEKDTNGIYTVECTIPKNILVPNSYKILVASHIPNIKIISQKEDAVSFTVEETGTDFHMYNGVDYGCVFVNCKWKNEKKNEYFQ